MSRLAPSGAAGRWRGHVALLGTCLALLLGLPLLPHIGPPAGLERQLRPGDAWRAQPALPTVKLTQAGHTRNARSARTPFALDVLPSPGTELLANAALRCSPGARCLGSLRFAVEARCSGRPPLRADWTVPAAWIEAAPEARPAEGPSAFWGGRRLRLGSCAGRATRLEFESEVVTEAEPGQAETPEPFWAEPLLLEPEAALPPIVLVSIDTLRADRLGAYGYARPTSPELDRLAAESVRFATALTSAPWTTPAHMSLFTGLDPSRHHVTLGTQVGAQRLLAPQVRTLAGHLRRAGYVTAAYTGGGYVGASLGFDRGFDLYLDGPLKATPEARQGLAGLLRALQPSPFFLFVHTFEVHAPYSRLRFARDLLPDELARDYAQSVDTDWITHVGQRSLPGPTESAFVEPLAPPPAQVEPPEVLLARRGHLTADVTSALYDGGVRAADTYFGDLRADLERLGLWDRAAVIVTADHGEEFAEHDPSHLWDAHCVSQYDELLRVPLIVKMPGLAPRVVQQPARLVDLLPTLLDWLALPVPSDLDGRSLVPLLNGESLPAAWSLSEATCVPPELKALRGERFKYVASWAAGSGATRSSPTQEWLFDLIQDPAERHDLSGAEPETLARLRGTLHGILADPRRRPPAQDGSALGEETRERLRALGYVD